MPVINDFNYQNLNLTPPKYTRAELENMSDADLDLVLRSRQGFEGGGVLNALTASYLQNLSEIGGKSAFFGEDDPAAERIKSIQEEHPVASGIGTFAGQLTNPITLAAIAATGGQSLLMKGLTKAGKFLTGGAVIGAEEAIKSADVTRTLIGAGAGAVVGPFMGKAPKEHIGKIDKLIRKLNVEGVSLKEATKDLPKSVPLLETGTGVPKQLEGSIRLGGERAPTPRTAREDAKAVNEFFKSIIPDTPKQLEKGAIKLGGEVRAPKEVQSVEGIYNQLIEVIDEQGRRIIVSPDGTTYIIK